MHLLRFDLIRLLSTLYLGQTFLSVSLINSQDDDGDVSVQFSLYGCNNKNKALVFKFNPKMTTAENTTTDFLKYFLPCSDVKIIAHGWHDNVDDEIMLILKNAYLESNCYNIIIVDWSLYAKELLIQKAAKATLSIGKHVAGLVNFLVMEHFTELSRVHLIGFEMGAHLMGSSGKFAKQKIPRITGLDPSKLFFEIPNRFKPLGQNDAEFVDVIHTTAGTTGVFAALGQVDFYPNAGVHPQPGCPKNRMHCSSERSVLYFAESITTEVGFYGYPCKYWFEFEYGNCKTGEVLMGESAPKTAPRGKYMLKTKESAPFASGK